MRHSASRSGPPFPARSAALAGSDITAASGHGGGGGGRGIRIRCTYRRLHSCESCVTLSRAGITPGGTPGHYKTAGRWNK